MENFQSLEQIETKAECDGPIAFVESEIVAVTFQKVTAEHEGITAGQSSQSLEVALTKASSDLAAVNTVLPTLNEGPIKEKQITEQMRLQLRVRILSAQAVDKGILSLVKNELEIFILEKHLELLNQLKTDLIAKKDALPA